MCAPTNSSIQTGANTGGNTRSVGGASQFQRELDETESRARGATVLSSSSPSIALEVTGVKRKAPSTPLDEVFFFPAKAQRAAYAQDLSLGLRKIEAREVVDPASCPTILRCPLTGCGKRNLEITHIIPVKFNGILARYSNHQCLLGTLKNDLGRGSGSEMVGTLSERQQNRHPFR